MIPLREGVSQLLSGPLGSGMSSQVDENDSSSVMREEDQDVEQLESDGWDNKEVHRNDLCGVVLQERLPALPGCSLRSPGHISLHGGF